uniref:RNA-directed DNA polymerase, eukaryota, reverse transcriptase zinc-binding domain protein n=1 Tax=Tanacetum cinerariifolium TaxID=118510 RepID=A0A6L2LA35_TANCI|nr:RNA-directed DNA polymerase, eukaryota, reverse transcriptase zinc-binding domain protein [Tanacetum cinerariifolium]
MQGGTWGTNLAGNSVTGSGNAFCILFPTLAIILNRLKKIHSKGLTCGDEEDLEDDMSQSGDKVTQDNDEVNKKVKEATSNEVNELVNSTSNKLEESVSKGKLSLNNSVCLKRVHTRGLILQLIDELVKEIKMESMKLVTIMMLWGNSSLDYVLSSSLGDFNEVRTEQERYGSVFNIEGANAFNSFIYLESLIDHPLDGYAYIWAYKTGNKMKDTWKSLDLVDSNCMINLKKKLQALKIVIKQWTKNAKKSSYKVKFSIQCKLSDIDKILDQEAAQKSKVCWAIEGDENTKLSLDQHADLKRNVSNKEIKSVIWDYETNKSPGSDGFTFEFFRRYWKLFEHDIVAAVKEFFASDTFPPGCNSSFIALIPKIHGAKVIKDYRPISLIEAFIKLLPRF